MPQLLGIDIGGTKIGLCVGTPDGHVLARQSIPTARDQSPESILADCRDRLFALLADAAGASAAPAAVGASCPGPLDYPGGRFLDPPNMPRWHGFAIRDWLAANFPCRAGFMNDANATALAEWKWGAARGTTTAIFLTMSTGMGAGLIIDGRLYEGPLGLAGEIGRIRLRDDGPVGFAKRGSAEGFLSGPGMSQLAQQEALICTQRGEASMLREIVEAGGAMSAEALCAAAESGDAAARRVTDRIAVELGRLCAILTDVLNPDVIVLGTIGTAHPDLFIPGASRVLLEEGVAASARHVRIVPSALAHRGDQSALAVAARLCD
ncbi:MAG: ROK family protein [Phycisphaeraceae bacterium]|nr:ROK family protein [Phycisphaeraceae bacterium]